VIELEVKFKVSITHLFRDAPGREQGIWATFTGKKNYSKINYLKTPMKFHSSLSLSVDCYEQSDREFTFCHGFILFYSQPLFYAKPTQRTRKTYK
jgi:hypothetical protein